MEEQRRKRHELEAHTLGLAPRKEISDVVPAAEPPSVQKLIDRYLDQIKTVKEPTTPQEVRRRPDKTRKVFDRRTLESISTEELNDYVVAFDEIRDVGKHGSPERRDHRPILQAERKAWPDSAAPPPGRKGVRLKLCFWGMRTHEASSIIRRE